MGVYRDVAGSLALKFGGEGMRAAVGGTHLSGHFDVGAMKGVWK